jgi:hypothetical protein
VTAGASKLHLPEVATLQLPPQSPPGAARSALRNFGTAIETASGAPKSSPGFGMPHVIDESESHVDGLHGMRLMGGPPGVGTLLPMLEDDPASCL